MTAMTTSQPGKLREWFSSDSVKTGITDALCGYMDTGSFLSQMLIAFRDEKIADCTPASMFEAAHVCATLQLLPNLGQVALIARNIKDKGKCCTVMPQWQGYQALMLRNPEVKDVKAVLVHRTDAYEFDPESESLRHSYDPFDEKRSFKDFEDVRGGYLVVMYRDNRPKKYHFVTVDVMRRARACAQADNIWKAWFMEQCLKTVYRNAYARRVVPIDPVVNARLQKFTEADDLVLENDPVRVMPVSAPVVGYTPEVVEQPASRSAAVAAKTRKKDAPQEQTTAVESLKEEPYSHEGKVFDDFQKDIAEAGNVKRLRAISAALHKAELDVDSKDELLQHVDARFADLNAG